LPEEHGAPDGSMLEIAAESFAVPDISIDYAVMERSSEVACASRHGLERHRLLAAMRELTRPDDSDNRALSGDAIFVDSSNVYVHGDGRVVAAVGVQNLMIVDSPDALLVVHPTRRKT
jgi:mannose-1-phosphate guanylyltransferase